MRTANHIVTENDERPARLDGTCFYCRQGIGKQHSKGCVCRDRSVVMTVTVELLVNVPEDYAPDDIIDYWTGTEAGCCVFERGICDAAATGWARKNITSLGFAREASQRDVEKLGDNVDWDGKTYSPGMVFSQTFLDKVRDIANARDKWQAERGAAK